MNRHLTISIIAILAISCGASINLDRSAGDVAYSACLKALVSVVPDLENDELMIVQIADLGRKNGDVLKESRIFTYPKPHASPNKPTSVCKADMRAKQITELSYQKQNIIVNVSEELRTF